MGVREHTVYDCNQDTVHYNLPKLSTMFLKMFLITSIIQESFFFLKSVNDTTTVFESWCAPSWQQESHSAKVFKTPKESWNCLRQTFPQTAVHRLLTQNLSQQTGGKGYLRKRCKQATNVCFQFHWWVQCTLITSGSKLNLANVTASAVVGFQTLPHSKDINIMKNDIYTEYRKLEHMHAICTDRHKSTETVVKI